MPRMMYSYFLGYDEPSGAPSFSKFARKIGVRCEDIESYRSHPEFDAAYRECEELRRDYLVDMALIRRFDPTFTKFLVSELDAQRRERFNLSHKVTLCVTKGKNGD